MAEPITQVLGIVGIKNRGEYDENVWYEKLNTVRYQGQTYCAKTDTQGNLPTNTLYWDLMVEKGEKGDKPVKGVDYYTSEDKQELITELEGTLDTDVTSEVTEQLSDLTSATPTAVSSTSAMTDTSKIYVLTTDGHWYWNNGTTWVDGGIYQATSDHDELEDARESFGGIEYSSLGQSIRTVTEELYNEVRNDKPSEFFGLKKLNFGKIYGKSIHFNNGLEYNASDYYSSDFIDVSKYRRLYVSFTGGGSSNTDYTGIVGYDENHDYVAGLANQHTAYSQSGARHSVSNVEVDIPDNVKYIRGCTAYKNSTSSNYEYTELLILAECLNEKEKNDFYTYEFEYLGNASLSWGHNYIDKDTGEIAEDETTSTSYSLSDYIPVNFKDKLYITGSYAGNCSVCAYDENKNFVECICSAYDEYNIKGRNIFKKNITYEVPQNVKYIRGSSKNNTLIIKKIKSNNTSKKFLSFNSIYGKTILSASGNEGNSNDYYSTDFIDVKPGEKYYLTAVLGGGDRTSWTGVAGYDIEGNYVRKVYDRRNITISFLAYRIYVENEEFVIPDGVYKIRACTAYRQSTSGIYRFYPYSELYISKKIENESTIIESDEETKDELVALSEFNTLRSGSASSSTGYKKLFTIAATSDIHHDANQWELFKENSNKYKDFLDCSIFTGDLVQLAPNEDISFYQPSEFINPLLSVVGNHDSADAQRGSISQQTIFTRYIQPLVSAGFINATNPYYYKDFSTYKIRVIVLHEYEGAVEDATGTSNHYRRYMTSMQLQWFADTLYNTPTDYSVIVLTHQIINYRPEIVDCKFTGNIIYRSVNAAFNSGWGYALNNMNGNPIGDIVNAFKTSGIIEQTYTNNAGLSNSSVSKDFSNRENGKFICFISGHSHFPFVLRDGTYNDQVQILLPSGSNSYFQRKQDDIRPFEGILNSYYLSFDTTNKLIKLLKAGHRTTMDMVERDMMIIKYDE